MKHNRKKNLLAIACFIGPSLIGLLIFYIIPFFISLYYSFLESPITKKFVLLDNYFSLLSNKMFLKACSNTIYFMLICIPIIIIVSFAFALLLNNNLYSKNFLRSSFIIPLVIPVATVVLFWEIVFDYHGALNWLLNVFDIKAIAWIDTGYIRIIVILIFIWKYAGYNMILFVIGLKNIPREYYDTAKIEGASKLKMFKSITLVYIIPTGFFVLIISIVNSFKVFREAYLIGGKYPHSSIYMLQHYMNNVLMKFDYQKLTTAATILFFLIYIAVMLLYKLERKISNAIN